MLITADMYYNNNNYKYTSHHYIISTQIMILILQLLLLTSPSACKEYKFDNNNDQEYNIRNGIYKTNHHNIINDKDEHAIVRPYWNNIRVKRRITNSELINSFDNNNYRKDGTDSIIRSKRSNNNIPFGNDGQICVTQVNNNNCLYCTNVITNQVTTKCRQHNAAINNGNNNYTRKRRQSYNDEQQDDYSFPQEYYTNDEDDQDENENLEQEYIPPAPAYASSSDTCTKVIKDGSVCTVCNNPNSPGKYERCSYQTDPGSNSYEYSRSAVYGNHNGRPRRNLYNENIKSNNNNNRLTTNAVNLIRERNKRQKDNNLRKSLYDSYFHDLFPELSDDPDEKIMNEPSLKLSRHNNIKRPLLKASSSSSRSPLRSNGNRKEQEPLEKMLKEFHRKDRSACKKVVSSEDNMTCFKCTDKNGLKTEECMYATKTDEPDEFK